MCRSSFGVVRRAFLAAMATVLVASCTKEPAPRSDAEIVVARVDGDRITLKELKNEIAARRGFAPSLSAKSASRGEVSETLRVLIDRAVILAEGKKLGVAVSGSEVDGEVDRFRSDFPPGGLERALLQAGLDMESWREGLSRSLLVRKVAAAIAATRAELSSGELEAELRRRATKEPRPERIRVRQYLFDAEESAARARTMIREGEKPEEVIPRFSVGDVRPSVVDLGEIAREDLPEEIAAELFGLGEGEVSRVIPREQSYSLFLVIRKEPARTVAPAGEERAVREELLRAKRQEAFRNWVRERVGKAEIRVQEALLDQFVGGSR